MWQEQDSLIQTAEERRLAALGGGWQWLCLVFFVTTLCAGGYTLYRILA